MKTLRYYGDLAAAPLLSLGLLYLFGFQLGSFVLGVVAWSFSEYAIHRWVLHSRPPNALHIEHHAHPNETVLDTAWQVYAGIGLAGLIVGSSFAAGVLASYAWYLYVHHCCHHWPQGIPPALLEHHESHHRFGRRNFGVGTTAWDRLFRTRL